MKRNRPFTVQQGETLLSRLFVGVVVGSLSLAALAGPSCPQLLAGSPVGSVKAGPLTAAASNQVYGPIPLHASSQELHQKFWSEAGLPAELFAHYVSNENCYEDFATFAQCMAAINTLLATEETRAELIPSDEYMTGKFSFTSLRDMGGAQIVTWTPAAKEPREILKERHAFEKAVREGWLKFLNSGKQIDLNRLAYSMVMSLKRDPDASMKVANAINEYLQVVDAHARIMPLAELKNESSSDVTDKLVGIGIQVSESEGAILIEGVIEGGPAEAGGLKAGDVIVGVDGKSIVGDLKAAMKGLRGPEDTRVVVTVKRGTQTQDITLIRKPVEMKNVSSKIVDDGKNKAGYVKLASFMVQNAPAQLAEAIEKLESQGAKSLVLDLRGNPGGSLQVAVDIASIFLGPGKDVVIQKSLYPQAIKDETHTTDKKQVTNLPLVVLVDAGSASASELLSGALQDHKRAWVVGERTFGKGTVQSGLRPMGEHQILQHFPVIMFLTTARFYLPSGRTNQLVGVTPDFEAPIRPGEVTKRPREADIYPNALTSEGEASHSSRPEELVTKLRACIEETGTAKTGYLKPQNGLPRDYAMHVTFDLLNCFDKLGIQAMARAYAFEQENR